MNDANNNLNIVIEKYNDDGTANLEVVAIHVVNTPEELEALFNAAVANA